MASLLVSLREETGHAGHAPEKPLIAPLFTPCLPAQSWQSGLLPSSRGPSAAPGEEDTLSD